MVLAGNDNPTIGVEAIQAGAQDYLVIRIIGLSMFDEADRAWALRDAGAVAYLTKSGPPADLVAAIRQCMDGSAEPHASRPGRKRRASKKRRS